MQDALILLAQCPETARLLIEEEIRPAQVQEKLLQVLGGDCFKFVVRME
jgi:hypothetical protein